MAQQKEEGQRKVQCSRHKESIPGPRGRRGGRQVCVRRQWKGYREGICSSGRRGTAGGEVAAVAWQKEVACGYVGNMCGKEG